MINRSDRFVERGVVTLRPTAVISATGDQGVGVELAGEGAALVAEAGSTITSDRYNAVTLLRGGTVTNAGRIESRATAAGTAAIMAVTGNSASSLAGTNPALGATITNSGEIISAGVGIGVGSTNVDSVNITNIGRIASASGQAFVGGVEVDTIDNRGRIEGAATLGAGTDRAVLREGGLVTGALDGGDGSDTLQVDVTTGSALLSDRVAGAVTNFELLEKTGAGTLTLTGVTAPRTALNGGTLTTSGTLTGMAVDAAANTMLNVSGSLGAVTLADGAELAPGGAGVGSITLASLALSGNSRLHFDLGAPNGAGASDLITVTGNLTLDGLVNVDATPAFGNGVYRLINYGGTLTDNGLVTGTVPTATYQVQTAVGGQVNLVVSGIASAIPATQFWDGANSSANNRIDGGAGVWSAVGGNWTSSSGDNNGSFGGRQAIFQGTAGTVTVDAGGVSAAALQFVTSGYRIEGGALTLGAPATIRVGDGTAAGASSSATIASVIAGSGGIDKADFGTLILSGANSYTGGTRVSGGVLAVAADAALGAASGGLTLDGGTLRTTAALTSARGVLIGAGGGTLDLGATALALSGVVDGAGALTVNASGAGTLSLAGNSAARTGATRIAGGTLALSGSLGGPLTIAAGARLTGTGTTGDLTVEGIVAPGNSPGTLTVNGNLVFAAGSTCAVELAASGARDLINVSGTATLTGGTVSITALDPELSYTNGASYRFITATGGLVGTFAGVRESSAFLDFALVYGANSVDVTVAQVRTFPEVARTFNQRGAAMGLRDLGQTVGSDALSVYQNILLLDADPARAAFDGASGEIYATTLAGALRRGALASDRLASRATAVAGAGWGLWGGAAGHDARVRGDGNGARYAYDGIGAEVGIDYRGPDNGWALGVGGGSSNGSVDLPGRASRADTDGWHIGGYARAGTGGTSVTIVATVAYADSDADVTRAIAFGALSRTATGRSGTTATTASLEARYGVATSGDLAFGPVVGVEYRHATLDGFTETGAGSLNLSAADNSDNATRASFGAFANLQGAIGVIDFSVRYATGGGDLSEVALALAGSPTPFRVRSAAGAGDALVARFAGDHALGGGWSLGGDVRATAGHGDRSIAGSATLAYRF